MTVRAASDGHHAQFLLADMWRPESLCDYKVHFARWNGQEQPLSVFARSFQDWVGWQRHYPGKNAFNRPYIFSLIQMPQALDHWLFGGVWRVEGLLCRDDGSKQYQVELDGSLEPLIGRLLIHRIHRQRGTRLNLENHFNDFTVLQVLPERYTGRAFPGYNTVHLTFAELEALIANNRLDWIEPLRHVKGVYLVRDENTRRSYVGSAYGDHGVWSRWSSYAALGHGGNLGMQELLRDHDLGYCRRHFRLTLLEHFDARIDDQTVVDREGYWKSVLGTRDLEIGLNRN
jgi:hypothetical protein